VGAEGEEEEGGVEGEGRGGDGDQEPLGPA
jgi:hypothetical protein